MLNGKLFSLILMALLLTACGAKYKTTYNFVPPVSQSGKMCTNQCQHAKSRCQGLCHSDYGKCTKRAKRDAQVKYQQYAAERRMAGKPLEKKLDYFYDASQCQQLSCGCDEEYRSCYQLCGGQIVPQKTCIAHCN